MLLFGGTMNFETVNINNKIILTTTEEFDKKYIEKLEIFLEKYTLFLNKLKKYKTNNSSFPGNKETLDLKLESSDFITNMIDLDPFNYLNEYIALPFYNQEIYSLSNFEFNFKLGHIIMPLASSIRKIERQVKDLFQN